MKTDAATIPSIVLMLVLVFAFWAMANAYKSHGRTWSSAIISTYEIYGGLSIATLIGCLLAEKRRPKLSNQLAYLLFFIFAAAVLAIPLYIIFWLLSFLR